MRDLELDVRELPHQAFPLVLPKPFGFEEALGRGRAIRRHRTATAGAGVMTLVVGLLGAVVLSRGPGGAQQIKPDRAPKESTQENVPYPPGDSGLPKSDPVVPDQSDPTDTTPPNDGGPGTGGIVRQPGGVEDPDGKPSKPDDVVPKSTKPTMYSAAIEQPNPCPPVVNPSEESWCTSVDWVDAGATVTLVFQVCHDVEVENPNPNSSRSLVFRTRQEADLRITDNDGNAVWQWSKGQRFPRYATGADKAITVKQGYCHQWWVNWDRTDEAGVALETGSYKLSGWSESENLEGRVPAERSISIP